MEEKMRNLTTNKEWEDVHKNKFYRLSKIFWFLGQNSFYMHNLKKKTRPYIRSGGKIIEIGCSPGNYVLALAKSNNLQPYGIEYTKEGVELTRSNFIKNKYNPKNVMFYNFFSKKFHKIYDGNFDVVCSFGFIEHFINVKNVIKLYADLVKKNGILIIVIPNCLGINKYVTDKKTLAKHNMNIMNPKNLRRNNVPSGLKIKKICYLGGLFNIGKFHYQIFSRVFLEPIWFLIDSLGVDVNHHFWSPSILMVCQKVTENGT